MVMHRWEACCLRHRLENQASAGTGRSKPADVPDGRLEIQLEDVCAQVDSFQADAQWVSRLAVSIHQLDVRDCSRPVAPSQHATRLLTHHASVRHPRDPAAPMFQVSPFPHLRLYCHMCRHALLGPSRLFKYCRSPIWCPAWIPN